MKTKTKKGWPATPILAKGVASLTQMTVRQTHRCMGPRGASCTTVLRTHREREREREREKTV